jgi:type VI secretion system ImpH/TssG family protein
LAAPTQPTTDHLNFIQTAAESIRRFGFFALARGAEARASGMPRIGRARLPADDILRMAHAPTMDFPAATLEGVEPTRSGGYRVRGYFLGLTGPMGPLPLHLTEYAAYERRFARSTPFGDFLDLISNRMLQFFYRAWADTQPAAQADRPGDDRFAGYLDALSGAADGSEARSAFTNDGRRFYAGFFAGRRSAADMQDAVSHVLGAPVRVREFVGLWRDITPEDQTRLGAAQDGLGQGAILGRRVRVADDTVRLTVRAETERDYDHLIPSGERFTLAAEAISAFCPGHLAWELELEVDERNAPAATLGAGGGRLGWSTWLAPRGAGGLRTDARLRRPAPAAWAN